MNPLLLTAFVDELEKIGAPTSFAKAKGIKRVGQLLSGSRAKALKEHAAHLRRRAGAINESSWKTLSDFNRPIGARTADLDRQDDLARELRDVAHSQAHKGIDEGATSAATRAGAGLGASTLAAVGLSKLTHKPPRREKATKTAAFRLSFLKELLKLANLLPASATPGGLMHAEGMLAGLAQKSKANLGGLFAQHKGTVAMARRAGHLGEGGTQIRSLLPGVGRAPSMAPALPGFSMPPAASMPGATIPAPR